MRVLFDASKGATEQDLMDAAALLERFKRRRDGEELGGKNEKDRCIVACPAYDDVDRVCSQH
jgi:hypothetical protein